MGSRRNTDVLKNLRKAERSIKELTFAADEDRKNHERMQALIDQLQGKVKSYKKQIEEAEEIAALNLAKYRKVAGALGDAAAAADAAEQEAAMRKARARSASLVYRPGPSRLARARKAKQVCNPRCEYCLVRFHQRLHGGCSQVRRPCHRHLLQVWWPVHCRQGCRQHR